MLHRSLLDFDYTYWLVPQCWIVLFIIPTLTDVITTTSPNSSMSPTHIFLGDTTADNYE